MSNILAEKTERRKSPQQKKQDEYDKDMRPMIENPHAFRKNWPRKKARVNRIKRRRIQRAVSTALAKNSIDNLSAESLKTIRPLGQWKKTGIISLRQNVENKLERRRSKRHR